MFRRERPQKGRYRQFFQIGAEVIGTESPFVDAEVIELVIAILHEVGIDDAHLLINSVGCNNCRPKFNEALRERLEGRGFENVQRLPAPRADQPVAGA